MSRKALAWAAGIITVIAIIAVVGWGYSTSWTFKKMS